MSNLWLPPVSVSATSAAVANAYGAWVVINATALPIAINRINFLTSISGNQSWLRLGVGPTSTTVSTIIATDIESNGYDSGNYSLPLFVPATTFLFVSIASTVTSAAFTTNFSYGWEETCYYGIGTETYYGSAALNQSRNIINAGTPSSLNGTTGHQIKKMVGVINSNGAIFTLLTGPSGSQKTIYSGVGNSTLNTPIEFPVSLPSGIPLWIQCAQTCVVTLLGIY